jgi:hypothetical protein
MRDRICHSETVGSSSYGRLPSRSLSGLTAPCALDTNMRKTECHENC